MSDTKKVRVSKEVHEELSEYCDENGLIMRDFVDTAIEKRLERHRKDDSVQERIKRLEEAIDLDTS